jgi:adenylate cyclase
MAYLEVLAGLSKGQQVPLTDETFVGRATSGWRPGDNLICVPDNRVSRRHARIVRQADHFIIEDLGSTNGVVVGYKRLAARVPYVLRDGDEIVISSTRFVFHTDASDQGMPAPSVPEEGTAVMATDDSSPQLEAPVPLPLLAQDGSRPLVAAILDASLDPAQVAEDERQSSKGLQEALKRLQAICQVSTALGAIMDRETLLQKIINCVFEIFPGVERAFILLRHKETGTLTPVVVKVRQDSLEQPQEVSLSESIIHEVIAQKHSILSYDALGDERFSAKTSVIGLSIRSMMCAPLLVGDEILGLLQVDNCTSPQCFTSEDLQILTGISTQAAIAVKNMQLYEAIGVETARRTSLQRYFSPRLVEMLMSGDITTELGGSVYHGVVLFADIIGFTALSERMTPADIMALLNRYFTGMQKVIYENGGSVDKLSGDGIMAFWGGPHAEHGDASDAVFTALRMQQQLWFINLDLALEKQLPLHVGMGLHMGEFIAGNVGSEDKIDFTLLGDTVNVASRIERLASRHQVLVSETIWHALKPLAYAVQLPPIKVKGKSAPITVYSVRGLRREAQSGCMMALPCSISDSSGRPLGNGLITGASHTPAGLSMRIRTTAPLTRNVECGVQLTLSEYHQPLQCVARVLSKLPGGRQGTVTHNKVVLTDLRGEPLSKFLTPGTSLTTAYQWDDLTRA